MNYFTKSDLVNLESKIECIEKNIVLKYNFKLPINFKKNYYHYKIYLNLLNNDKDCFVVIRNLIIDKNKEDNMAIWNAEHYELMNSVMSLDKLLKIIIKKALTFGFISIIQYKLIKFVHKKVINLWYTNKIFETFNGNNIKNLPNDKELKFFFNIIDIIIDKHDYINKDIDLIETNAELILTDEEYLNSIDNLKNIYKNLLVS